MDEELPNSDRFYLLRRLHRAYRPGRATYEKEDLYTEFLAWLLQRSRVFRIEFARLALGDADVFDPVEFAECRVETQVDTGGWGMPDLVLTADPRPGVAGGSPKSSCRVAVECKVDLELEESQLERYGRWLEGEASPSRNVALAALTRERIAHASVRRANDIPNWQGTFYWHDVGKKLRSCVQDIRENRLSHIDPTEAEFVGRAGFVVIALEFLALMEEEGMVAAGTIDPERDWQLFREYKRYRDRVAEILSLVKHAIDLAGIKSLLVESQSVSDVWTETRKNEAKGRPIWKLYVEKNPPASFLFGVAISPPNRYTRRPGETIDRDSYRPELVTAYTLADPSGSALHMDQDLEEISDALNEALSESDEVPLDIFVPENTAYHKWVARSEVTPTEDPEQQVEEMARFYLAFVSAFLKARAPDDSPILDRIRKRHREAVGQL